MSYDIQICIDCAHVHAQADWWSETLGWPVEALDQEAVDQLLASGAARPQDLIEHNGVRRWRTAAAILRPAEPGSPAPPLRILFQQVPEAKTVKDRIHLDIRLGGEDRDAVRSVLEDRGAVFLWEASEGPFTWYTLADPEGNEFCVG